eukprot:3075664-Alexandrium_andersonii.AAC.1
MTRQQHETTTKTKTQTKPITTTSIEPDSDTQQRGQDEHEDAERSDCACLQWLPWCAGLLLVAESRETERQRETGFGIE